MAKNRILFQKEKSFWAKHRIKIASTFVAIFIWFFVVSGNTYEYVTTVPILLPPSHDNFVITNQIPDQARIAIQGQGKTMLSFILFKEGRLQLNIDWTAGKQMLALSEKDILFTGNEDITVRKLLSPDTLVLQIESVDVKRIAVASKAMFKPHPGYTLVGDVLIEPPFVEIRGPVSALDSISSIQTVIEEFLDLKFPLHEKIDLAQPKNPLVSLLNQQVILGVEVQKLMEKQLTNIPVQVRNVPQGMNAFVIPSQLSLYVQGGVDLVFGLKPEDIQAYIVYKAQPDTEQTDYPVVIKPINEIRFRDIKPDSFKIVMERIANE